MSPSLSRQEYPVKSQTVRLDEFDQTFGQTTGEVDGLVRVRSMALIALLSELSSVALGARVSSVSDDFFAEASNLITIEVSTLMVTKKGTMG